MHNKFWLQYFWLLMLAWAIGACKMTNSGSKDKKQTLDSKSKLLIYIQQGACQGKCPQYEATLYTGQKMIYTGNKYMPVLGTYEYLLPPELTKNLIYEAIKMNLKLVPDSMPIPPNMAVTRLRIVTDGKERRIVGWTGGNEIFKKYIKLVYTEVRNMVEDQQGVAVPKPDLEP